MSIDLITGLKCQSNHCAVNRCHGATVGQVLLCLFQLFLRSFQALLNVEHLIFAALTVDLHQNLSRRNLQIVHQVVDQNRAVDRGLQICGPVILQLSRLVRIDGLSIHRDRGRGHHLRCQSPLVIHQNLRRKQFGALRGNPADHMYRLHSAGDCGHQSGDGDLHLLPYIQITGIGIAIILLQAHFRVVIELRHNGPLGNLLTGIQFRCILSQHNLTGVRRRQVQPRDILLQGGKLLFIARDIRARFIHSCTRRRRVYRKQRVPCRYLLSLCHKYLRHGTGSGDGNGLAVLCAGHTAALHCGSNRAVLHLRGHDLGLRLAPRAAKDFVQHQACRCQNRQNDYPADQTPPLFSRHILPFLFQGGLFRFRLRFQLRGKLFLSFHDFRHDHFSFIG